MNGVQHYLWRAVDQNGATIDILVQPRRDRWAALCFFRKLLDATGRTPRVIVTDKLRSYAAAKQRILPKVEHQQSRYLNNRAENSYRRVKLTMPFQHVGVVGLRWFAVEVAAADRRCNVARNLFGPGPNLCIFTDEHKFSLTKIVY